jgi:hypothetical protein
VFSNIGSLRAVVTLAVTILTPYQAPTANASNCRAVGKTVPLRDLPEASGVAASRRTPGLFWAHNDSGEPVIYALDSHGAIKGRVRVTGASGRLGRHCRRAMHTGIVSVYRRYWRQRREQKAHHALSRYRTNAR